MCELVIRDGFILNNTFFRSVKENSCVTWMLEHKDWVTSKIARAWQEWGINKYKKEHLNDCYDYLIYYFLTNEKEFNENYFIDVSMEDIENMSLEELDALEKAILDNNYKIEYYILSIVKKVAISFYTQEILSKYCYLDDIVDDKQNLIPSTLTEDYVSMINSYNNEAYINIENDPTLLADFEEYQAIYDYDLSIYDEDFQRKGLTGFSTKKFVKALFLSGLTTDEEFAEAMGVSTAQFRVYKSGFTSIVRNSVDDDYSDLEESIKTLIEGITRGWQPRD